MVTPFQRAEGSPPCPGQTNGVPTKTVPQDATVLAEATPAYGTGHAVAGCGGPADQSQSAAISLAVADRLLILKQDVPDPGPAVGAHGAGTGDGSLQFSTWPRCNS